MSSFSTGYATPKVTEARRCYSSMILRISNWGGDFRSRRSGHLSIVNSSPVGWKSKLRQFSSLSTLES